MNRTTLLLFLLALLGCRPGSGSDSEQKGALSLNFTRFPDPQNIPVCYLNPQGVAQEMLDDLKAVIVREYHGRTSIRFSGFRQCADNDRQNPTVRIKFIPNLNWEDGNGRWEYYGAFSYYGVVNIEASMLLPMGTQKRYATGANRGPTSRGWKGTIIHEFGHSIGLHHEHERADGKVCSEGGANQDRFQDGNQIMYVGKYDSNSIMNYCADDNYYNVERGLSAGDVAAIDYVYPRPIPAPPEGSLQVISKSLKRCLEAKDSKLANSSCETKDQQNFWAIFGGDGSYKLMKTATKLCLTTNPEGGTSLETCNSSPHQKLFFLPGEAVGVYKIQFATTSQCLRGTIRASDLQNTVDVVDCGQAAANFSFSGNQEDKLQ